MTCIVGIKDGSRIYLAGDKLGSSPLLKRNYRHSKVFFAGEFLVGTCGSYRLGQLLKNRLSEISLKNEFGNPMEILVNIVVPEIQKIYEDNNISNSARVGNLIKIEEDSCQLIVGFRKRLFEIVSDLSVLEALDDFTAVGFGCQYALGSLNETKELSPEKRIEKAFKTAFKYNPFVSGEFDIIYNENNN